jgi:L-galactose dehydrogenase
VEYQELGRTGLRVSRLGFGAAALGGVYGPADDSAASRVVRVALDLGVNIIDVSPYYGKTRAEAVLGRALRGLDRSSYLLATKVGRYGLDDFDFSADRVVSSVDESLARLGTDHLDLIQCHDIEFGDLDQVVTETIPALFRLRDQGKVRHVGITGYPVSTLMRVAERTALDTVLSYCRYTLLDRRLLSAAPFFESRGIGLMNASPLAMGLLTDGGPPSWHPAPARLRETAATVVRHCRAHGIDVAELALRFAIGPAAFATTFVGTADANEMARNVRWIDRPIDDDLLHEIDAILGRDGDQGWSSGRPENSSTEC